ncbi:hypothetical protein FRC06_003593 [Ceratobasidium sp. 370]|nr:hypothetical protein FRC06_003593 [Ceratobasidium sp. 370]
MSLNARGDLIVRNERFQLHVEKKTEPKQKASYVARTISKFQILKNGRPYLVPQEGFADPATWNRIRLKGFVASLAGASRHHIMAGWWSLTGFGDIHFEYMSIGNITHLSYEHHVCWRNGREPIWWLHTECGYAYALQTPDLSFGSTWIRTAGEARLFRQLLPPLHKPDWWLDISDWDYFSQMVPEIVAAQCAVPNKAGGQVGEADVEMNQGEASTSKDAGEGKREGKRKGKRKGDNEGEGGDECRDEGEGEGETDGEGGTERLRKKVARPKVYAPAREMEKGRGALKAGEGKGKAKDEQGQEQGRRDNQGEQDQQDDRCEQQEQQRQPGKKVAWKQTHKAVANSKSTAKGAVKSKSKSKAMVMGKSRVENVKAKGIAQAKPAEPPTAQNMGSLTSGALVADEDSMMVEGDESWQPPPPALPSAPSTSTASQEPTFTLPIPPGVVPPDWTTRRQKAVCEAESGSSGLSTQTLLSTHPPRLEPQALNPQPIESVDHRLFDSSLRLGSPARTPDPGFPESQSLIRSPLTQRPPATPSQSDTGTQNTSSQTDGYEGDKSRDGDDSTDGTACRASSLSPSTPANQACAVGESDLAPRSSTPLARSTMPCDTDTSPPTPTQTLGVDSLLAQAVQAPHRDAQSSKSIANVVCDTVEGLALTINTTHPGTTATVAPPAAAPTSSPRPVASQIVPAPGSRARHLERTNLYQEQRPLRSTHQHKC